MPDLSPPGRGRSGPLRPAPPRAYPAAATEDDCRSDGAKFQPPKKRTRMRGPVVAYTSRRSKASMIALRLFSVAQTAAKPDADIDHPEGPSDTACRCFRSGTESVPILPQKLGSSADDRPVCASVEPIMPSLNGLTPTRACRASPVFSAERT